MNNPVGISPAKAENVQLSKFVFSPGNCRNLGCPDIEANDDRIFIVHFMLFLVVSLLVFYAYNLPVELGFDNPVLFKTGSGKHMPVKNLQTPEFIFMAFRSEERRVGKECRYRR